MTIIIRSCQNACLYSVKSTAKETELLSPIRTLILHDSAYENDITISCDGRRFKTHKVLLALCSPVLKEIIAKQFKENEKALIILTQTTVPILEILLKYMYEGEVEIPGQHMHKFLEAGANLKIRGLQNGEIKFMNPTAERHSKCEPGITFDQSVNNKVPETPGKQLVQQSKKKHHNEKYSKPSLSSSSSKPADVYPDQETRPIQRGKHDQETDNNHTHYDLPQHITTVPGDSTIKRQHLVQQIKLVQKDLSDSDSDSSGSDDETSTDSSDSSVDHHQPQPELIDLEKEPNSKPHNPDPQTEPVKLSTRPNNQPDHTKVSNTNMNEIAKIQSTFSATHARSSSKLELDATKIQPVKRNAGNEMTSQTNKKVAPPKNTSQSTSHEVGQKRKYVPQDANTAVVDCKSTPGTLTHYKIQKKNK